MRDSYSTHAPKGHTCADCRRTISPHETAIRLGTDRVVDGRTVADYRHLACYKAAR